jgi:hypothetical protein
VVIYGISIPKQFPAYIAIVALDTNLPVHVSNHYLLRIYAPLVTHITRSFRTILPHPSSNHWLRSLPLSRCPRKRNLIKKIPQVKFIKYEGENQSSWLCKLTGIVIFFAMSAQYGRGDTELIYGLKKNTGTRRLCYESKTQHLIGFIPQAIAFQTFLSLSFVRVRSDFITLHLRPQFLDRFRCQLQANWLMALFTLASLLK